MLTRIKYFRRLYYNALIKYVEQYDNKDLPANHGQYVHGLLCLYKSSIWYFKGFCWKELKEVVNNQHSQYLIPSVRGKLNCVGICFNNNQHRIAFLKECIALMDKQPLTK